MKSYCTTHKGTAYTENYIDTNQISLKFPITSSLFRLLIPTSLQIRHNLQPSCKLYYKKDMGALVKSSTVLYHVSSNVCLALFVR